MIIHSDFEYLTEPGSSELITINERVDTVADIAGVEFGRECDPAKPQGMDGRDSGNMKG